VPAALEQARLVIGLKRKGVSPTRRSASPRLGTLVSPLSLKSRSTAFVAEFFDVYGFGMATPARIEWWATRSPPFAASISIHNARATRSIA